MSQTRTYPADKMIPPSAFDDCKTPRQRKTAKKQHAKRSRRFHNEDAAREEIHELRGRLAEVVMFDDAADFGGDDTDVLLEYTTFEYERFSSAPTFEAPTEDRKPVTRFVCWGLTCLRGCTGFVFCDFGSTLCYCQHCGSTVCDTAEKAA
jgi:hypothetical protein